MSGKGICRMLGALLLIGCLGCQSAYYAAWEKLGREKRHLLKSQVESAREEQEEASEQFQDVLSRIKSVYGFDGGDLETVYDDLKVKYEECERRVETVRDRIRKVERIASDLFAEWEGEIEEMESPALKRQSRRSLSDTRERYTAMHRSMVAAEASMDPVLGTFRDYVLYLKHNLNARAVGALKQEAGDIEAEVGALIRMMNRSIEEADQFLKTF